MKKVFALICAHRRIAYGIILAACAINGLTVALLTYDQSFPMGDPATFYSFAHNLTHGEVIYKDFIHFRTPGDYAFEASFLHLFGDSMKSLQFASYIETLVLSPLLMMVAAIMILKNKRNPFFLLATLLFIALMPAIIDLRVAFGLLTAASYYMSFESRQRRKLYLFLTGIFASLSFTFGQEIAAMVGVMLVAGEAFSGARGKALLIRLKPLIAGIVVGLLPLAIYILFFSSLSNFLYYSFWYAFLIQPKFMNLPFPAFTYGNIIYYLPFLIYWLCFLVLYANRKFGKPAAIVLGYGILQLISELGRTDTGHLLFSIPEIFIVTPLFLFSVRSAVLSRKTLQAFMPYGLTIIVLCLLAKASHSYSVLLVPFVMLYALDRRPIDTAKPKDLSAAQYNVGLLLAASFAIFVFLIGPVYVGTYQSVVAGWHNRHNTSYEIEGVHADPDTYQEVTAVTEAIQKNHPKTIFSYPIIAYFNTLAPHHASRFITFEFETTLEEQDQAIQDLKRTKPEVVVFAPMQAQELSSATWKISAYLTAHYEIQKEVSVKNIYWVMVPKAKAARDDKLVYQLYKDNEKGVTQGIQTSAKGLNNAILQNSQPVHFSVNARSGGRLSLALTNSVGEATNPIACGTVSLTYGSSDHMTTKVCSDSGVITLPLKANETPVRIEFKNLSPNTPIIWNNPEVTD